MPTYFIIILAITLFISIGTLFAYLINPNGRGSNKLLNQISLLSSGFITYKIYEYNSMFLGLFTLGICATWFFIIIIIKRNANGKN